VEGDGRETCLPRAMMREWWRDGSEGKERAVEGRARGQEEGRGSRSKERGQFEGKRANIQSASITGQCTGPLRTFLSCSIVSLAYDTSLTLVEMRRRKLGRRKWDAVVFGRKGCRVSSSLLEQSRVLRVGLRVRTEDESRPLSLSLKQPPSAPPPQLLRSARSSQHQ
jgi:hypothetical protein